MGKRLWHFFRDHSTYVIVILIVAGAIVYFLLRPSTGGQQTLVVHPAPFSQQISVSGKVTAAQDVDLGFSQSGRVAHVYAKVGDSVHAGSLLAEIENGDLRAAVLQKQAVVASQQAKLDSLKAGTRPEDIAVAQSTVDGDISALAQADQAVVNTISDAYAKSDDAIHNKLDQFISNPRSTTPQLTFTTSSSQLSSTISTERIGIEKTLSDWQASISSLTASGDLSAAAGTAQNALAQVSTILADGNAALSHAAPSPSASQSTIDGYTTNIATARTTINASIASINTAITTQKAAASALDSARKNLTFKQAGSTSQDIAAQDAQVQAAQADLQNAQAQLTKTLVVAPFEGTVTRMDAKVGQVISPTTPQISMISNGRFQIDTYVPEVEITGLSVGNPATTTLDAYGPDTFFGATVISIDPAETIVNGVSTYKTTLQFNDNDSRIRSGMTASVVITTQTKANVLVVPQGAIFLKNGAQVVQIERDSKIVDVPVSTGGVSAIGNVEITQGLSDGDIVVLNPDVTK